MTSNDELRWQAEDAALAKAVVSPADSEPLSLAATRRLLHELRVHQIELEMQNEELRRAQGELDAARARYFDLYDLAPVGYVTVSEAGAIVEANLTAAALLGVVRGALVQQPFTRFVLSEDQDIYYRYRLRLAERPGAAGPSAVAAGPGIPRESAGADGPRAPGSNPLASAARTGSASASAVAAGSGIPRESAGADGPRAPEDRGADLQCPSQGCELRLVRADGTAFWARLEATVAPAQSPSPGPGTKAASVLRIVLNDITERKRDEAVRRDAETRYRLLFEHSPEGVVVLDPATARPVEFNEAAHRQLGYSREEFARLSLADIEAAETPAETQGSIARVLRDGRYDFETRQRTRQGEIRSVHVTAQITEILGQRVYHCIWQDITERKRAETALRASEARLRQLALELSRVEERERQRLAVCLHDEVAQALAVLRLKLGVLAATLGPGPAQAEITPLRDLLETTIDQTRTLVFDLSPPILYELGLAAAIEWAGEKIGRDHGLTFVCRDDGEPKPLDDERKMLLFRCTRELMLNTVKHARAERLTVTLRGLGDRVCAVVGDDGCGFDPASLDRRTHEVGFGLFSVRERLAAAGGRCEVESAAGVGTRVTLTVPSQPPK